ncbi:DUF4136 domain-containing protein [Mucilaginibacter puniceus]
MKKLTTLLACIVFAGCSSYQYYAIQSDKVSLNKYRTFAWLPVADTSRRIKEIVDEKIKDEVTAGLKKRGLLLNTKKPDLLVRYTIEVESRFRIFNYPTYVYGPSINYQGVVRNRYGGYYYYIFSQPYPVFVAADIIQIPYKEGNLIIDLIEQKNHQVIWRGYGKGEIYDPEKAIADIPEVVEGILNKLPIAALTKASNQ